jgi:hypothetical protein
MEVIVIRSLSHWISAQGIIIRVFHTWTVHYFEAEVLQHINPSAPLSMRVRYCRQPFKWLVVCPQSEVCSV